MATGSLVTRGSDKLVGTWKLVSASLSTAGGERNDAPFGQNPTGFLTYTGEGRMAGMISYSGRKPLSVSDWSLAEVEEKAEAFSTFGAYAGRYTLREDRVIHHVEISSLQNWVNTDLVRLIKFQGDRLILVTPPTSVKEEIQTWELVWERVPANSY
ncbi:MAG TPA: lipocalin-like domain-containing protein [Candidatus Angelobacter sp.]